MFGNDEDKIPNLDESMLDNGLRSRIEEKWERDLIKAEIHEVAVDYCDDGEIPDYSGPDELAWTVGSCSYRRVESLKTVIDDETNTGTEQRLAFRYIGKLAMQNGNHS